MVDRIPKQDGASQQALLPESAAGPASLMHSDSEAQVTASAAAAADLDGHSRACKSSDRYAPAVGSSDANTTPSNEIGSAPSGERCDDERRRRRRAVLVAMAEQLSARSLHDDAAMAYLAAEDLVAALGAYRSGGSFQMALALAGVPLDETPAW